MKNLYYSFMELTVKFVTKAQRERQTEVTYSLFYVAIKQGLEIGSETYPNAPQ